MEGVNWIYHRNAVGKEEQAAFAVQFLVIRIFLFRFGAGAVKFSGRHLTNGCGGHRQI